MDICSIAPGGGGVGLLIDDIAYITFALLLFQNSRRSDTPSPRPVPRTSAPPRQAAAADEISLVLLVFVVLYMIVYCWSL
jgi:hypothetical protein